MSETWPAGKHIGGELYEPWSQLAFTSTDIDEVIFKRIDGISYKQGKSLPLKDLRYLRIPHRDYSEEIILGEMICNASIADDLVSIFKELFILNYPIERMVLVDNYQGDDVMSMSDNNTSCFNYREVPWGGHLSRHAYGLAVDINPKFNPLVRIRNGTMLVSPGESYGFADRTKAFCYKISKGDACCRLFEKHGFRWGGSWNTTKDYQHFEKLPDK